MRVLPEKEDSVQVRETAVLILFRESDFQACLILANTLKSTGRAVYGLVSVTLFRRDAVLGELKVSGVLDDCIAAPGPCIAMGDALSVHARLLRIAGVRRVLTLSIWAGHGVLASELNCMEGLSDSSCHGLTLALDRWQMRKCLRQANLSSLRTIRVVRECVLHRARQSGNKWLLKSRRVSDCYRSHLLTETHSFGSLKGENSLVIEQFVHGTPCVAYLLAHAGRMFVGLPRGLVRALSEANFDESSVAEGSRWYLEQLVISASRSLGLTQGVFRFDLMLKGSDDAEVITVAPVGSHDLLNEMGGIIISDILVLFYLSQVDLASRVRLEQFLDRCLTQQPRALSQPKLRASKKEFDFASLPTFYLT